MSIIPHANQPTCPFCPFSVASDAERDMYGLMEHLELSHPEGDSPSPFVVRDTEPPSPRSRSRAGTSYSSGSKSEGASRGHSRTPSTDDASEWYIECPSHCGEAIHIRELDQHMELHDMENVPFEDRQPHSSIIDTSPHRSASRSPKLAAEAHAPTNLLLTVPSTSLHSSSSRYSSRSKSSPKHALSPFGSLRGLLLGPASTKTRSTKKKSSSPKSGVRRLGKSELGPYAYEEQMPTWLHNQLERGAKVTVSNEIGPKGDVIQVRKVANETEGVIPVLAQLCEQDKSISKVFLCHPSAKHIFKMSAEGGFCGYRNIQMAISFLQGTQFPGGHHFPGPTPSILRLQDLIELAWDKGINSSGRIETGGIAGTRKYIGTPEAQGLFCSLNISCEANAFNTTGIEGSNIYVHDAVIKAILEYFSSGVIDPQQKVYQTGLAPVYFQHPGHSLTIVGLEVRKSGEMNLLVFDPMFKTPPGIVKMIGSRFKSKNPGRLLKAFRRGDSYLGKYNSFEILKLTNPLYSLPSLHYEQDLETAHMSPLRGDGSAGELS